MKFHFAWGHWAQHQDLLVLRRNSFFPEDYGKYRRHRWLRLYRRWKKPSDEHYKAFLRFVGGNFARGSDMSAGWEP